MRSSDGAALPFSGRRPFLKGGKDLPPRRSAALGLALVVVPPEAFEHEEEDDEDEVWLRPKAAL